MMTDFDADLDLKLERLIRATPETIWRCWTEPDLFAQWYVPKPVEVVEVNNDLKPGGRSSPTMKLPDGTVFPGEGCFLLIEPMRRIVITDALTVGFRPAATPFMTADITLTPADGGTLYAAHVMHPDAEARKKHEAMGFKDGWSTALEQLDALVQTL